MDYIKNKCAFNLSLFMDWLKRNLDLPLGLLIVGCLFVFLPSFFPDFKILYVLGVWVWPFCLLYYCRQSGECFKKSIFCLFLTAAISIRFGSDLVFFGLAAIASVVFYIPFFVDKHFCTKDAPFYYTLIFPSVYSVVNITFTIFDVLAGGNLAYAQYDNRALLQLTSVIGEYGLTFFICFVASAAAYVVAHWEQVNAKRIGVAILLSVVAAHAWGFYILSGEADSNTIRLAQTIGPKLEQLPNGEWVNLPIETNFESFNKIVNSAHEQNAEMLIMNEEAFTIADTNAPAFIENAAMYAKKFSMPILLPLEVDYTDSLNKGRYKNVAFLFDSEGKIVAEYNKHKPLPIVETFDMDVGREKVPTIPLKIGGENYLVSYAICYDGNFTEIVRAMGDSVQVYFNPSWDWEGLNDFHYRMLAVRAVENGVNMVMITYDGISVVTNDYGKEIFRKGIEEIGYEKVFITDVPTGFHVTVYGRFGNIINWVYLVLAVLLLSVAVYRKHAKKPAASAKGLIQAIFPQVPG